MKKILTILIAAVLVGAFALQSLAVQPKYEYYGTPGKKIKLWCIIEFGRKKYGCTRFGICKLFGGWEPLAATGTTGTLGTTETNGAHGEVYMDGDTFVIEFLTDDMGKDTRSIYFNNNFKVEEDFEIPREILDKLKHEGNYIITQGEYPIQDTKSRLIVRF